MEWRKLRSVKVLGHLSKPGPGPLDLFLGHPNRTTVFGDFPWWDLLGILGIVPYLGQFYIWHYHALSTFGAINPVSVSTQRLSSMTGMMSFRRAPGSVNDVFFRRGSLSPPSSAAAPPPPSSSWSSWLWWWWWWSWCSCLWQHKLLSKSGRQMDPDGIKGRMSVATSFPWSISWI